MSVQHAARPFVTAGIALVGASLVAASPRRCKKVDSAHSTTVTQPTAKDVDVKTGNKVEPQTTTGSGATKSGDAVTSSADHAASSEQASSTDNTNATAAASGAEKGADSSSS